MGGTSLLLQEFLHVKIFPIVIFELGWVPESHNVSLRLTRGVSKHWSDEDVTLK